MISISTARKPSTFGAQSFVITFFVINSGVGSFHSNLYSSFLATKNFTC